MEPERDRQPTAEGPGDEPAEVDKTDDVWRYPETVGRLDLAGFKVEASDGEIGKVDETNLDAGYLVVDSGTWIFGKKILLPAGVIDRVDRNDERVYVDSTKGEIEGAPDYDENQLDDDDYRESIGRHYATRADASDPSA
jgi:PRC-barrel domain protein